VSSSRAAIFVGLFALAAGQGLACEGVLSLRTIVLVDAGSVDPPVPDPVTSGDGGVGPDADAMPDGPALHPPDAASPDASACGPCNSHSCLDGHCVAIEAIGGNPEIATFAVSDDYVYAAPTHGPIWQITPGGAPLTYAFDGIANVSQIWLDHDVLFVAHDMKLASVDTTTTKILQYTGLAFPDGTASTSIAVTATEIPGFPVATSLAACELASCAGGPAQFTMAPQPVAVTERVLDGTTFYYLSETSGIFRCAPGAGTGAFTMQCSPWFVAPRGGLYTALSQDADHVYFLGYVGPSSTLFTCNKSDSMCTDPVPIAVSYTITPFYAFGPDGLFFLSNPPSGDTSLIGLYHCATPPMCGQVERLTDDIAPGTFPDQASRLQMNANAVFLLVDVPVQVLPRKELRMFPKKP
jgi:hypothetical protein